MKIRCEKCGRPIAVYSDELEEGSNILVLCRNCGHNTLIVAADGTEPLPKDKASFAIDEIIKSAKWINDIPKSYSEYILEQTKIIELELKAKDEQIESLEDVNEELRSDFEELDEELMFTEKLLDGAHHDIKKVKRQTKQLEEQNEELADLVVKWEASYTKLRRKIDDLL